MSTRPSNNRAGAWLAAAVFCESLQWLIALSVISHYVPIDRSAFMARSFDKIKAWSTMTRQVPLHRVFGFLNVILAYVAWRLFRNRLQDAEFVDGIKKYTWVNVALIAWQTVGIFEIVARNSPGWAWGILYTGLGAAVFVRMFWKEILAVWRGNAVHVRLKRQPWLPDAILVSVMTAVIFRLAGTHPIAGVQVSLYMMVLYAALRVREINPLIAAAGVYAAVKWLFIYAGMPAGFKTDAVVLLFGALYMQRTQWRYMALAAAAAGYALLRDPVYGIPQAIMVSVFTAGAWILDKPEALKAKACLGLPWLMWGLGWACGWANQSATLEAGRQILAAFQGADQVPWYTPLLSHQFFIFVAAAVAALVYALWAMIAGTAVVVRSIDRRHWLTVTWALYGLLCSGAYAYISVPRMHYFISFPLVVIACHTAQLAYTYLRRGISAGKPLWVEGDASNITLVSWLVSVEIVQAVIYAYRLLGYNTAAEPLIYAVMVMIAVGGMAFWIKLRPPRTFIITETILVALQLCALWQMLIYSPRSQLAHGALTVLIVLSILTKVFWTQLCWLGRLAFQLIFSAMWKGALRPWADAAVGLFIAALIYVPDPEAAFAKMFLGEHCHHYDFTIMAPAFASRMGNMLYIDTFTTYGFGMPIVMGWLSNFFGGFGDVTIFRMVVVLCIISYLCYYAFLRYWLGSIVLSVAAILMGMKWQMFYTFAYPMTFTYPDSTSLRFGTDVLFLLALTFHIRTGRRIFLWLGGICIGFAMFFLLSTGVDMLGAFWAYVTLCLAAPQYRSRIIASGRQWWQAGLLYATPLIAGFALYVAFAGHWAFTHLFWSNMMQSQTMFIDGTFFSPYLNGWKHAEYLNDWMGLLLPAVQLGTVVYVIIKVLLKKEKPEDFFLLLMGVYGYGMYVHFVALCVGNNYYMRALPFVFLCFYWIKQGIDRLPEYWQPRARLSVLGLCAFALFTNHNYISHPNMLCVSRNPMVDPLVAEPLPDGRPYFYHPESGINESFLRPVNSMGQKDEGFVSEYQFPDHAALKAYYRQESDFSAEAAFIASLTSPEERVPLICSWDWRILEAAHRKPYFYAFSFFGNRPLKARSFPDTSLYTKEYLNRELENFEKYKPRLVFIQRIFWDTTIPQWYFYETNNEGLMALLDYLHQHYETYKEGPYLFALKRIEGR